MTQRLIQLLSERSNLDLGEITASTRLDALGLDSLELVDLSMALEDDLGAPSIGGDDWDRLNTVQDLIDFCSREK